MTDFVGLDRADALQVGGTELNEEASQLSRQASQLFDAMETDVRTAMDGSAPSAFMSAHSNLGIKFNDMMEWLSQMGINLSEVNGEILQADDDNMLDFQEAGDQFDGLPRINI